MDRLQARLPAATLLVLAVVIAVAACGSPTSSSGAARAPRVTYTPGGCIGVDLDAIGKTTASTIDIENQSDVLVYIEPGRVLDGSTFDDFARHVAEEQSRHERGEPLAGPPAFIERAGGVDLGPGTAATLPVPTTPGTYGIACVVFDTPDGPPVDAFVVGPRGDRRLASRCVRDHQLVDGPMGR